MVALKNQVVLITGCSSGIGRALAPAFAAKGHRVFATARRPETLSGLKDLTGGSLTPLALDVTDGASIRKAVDEVLRQAGRINMIVNNAGWNLIGPLAEIALPDLRREFETNVVGPLALAQAVIPQMVKQGGGRIVNVGSVVGILPTPLAGAYCASKSAIHTLSEVLRMEVAPFGIDVVIVQPGAIRSSISENADVGLERYEREDSLYKPLAQYIKRRAHASQSSNPTPAGVFAEKMVAAVMKKRAPLVVRIGKGSGAAPIAKRVIPERVLDKVLTAPFGLEKLRGK